jgi:glycosyltransferase involved in cell wall biosynthesis
MPNPVCELCPITDKLPTEYFPVRFLFLGHVHSGKGIFELTSACAQLDAAQFRLSIVGNILTDDHQKLILTAGDGYERWLRITGELSHDKCLQELVNADVLVLPSTGLFEAFPNVVLEAMMAGLPVIATDRGAISEMLAIGGENPCGLIVEAENVSALKVAMEKLIADSSLRKKLGVNGRERARRLYNVHAVVASLKKAWGFR